MNSMWAADNVPAGLEDFRVGRLIGRGMSANVYHAIHLELDQPVALKLWHAPLSDRQARQFTDECRLQFALSDEPHIVRLLWAKNAPGQRPWLALDLYEQSLGDRLGSGPMRLADALGVAEDLLSGLQALHARGHVHRDVKPGNVLLRRGRAALGDLGLAMATSAETRDRAAGTSRYVAPELSRGAAPSPRSDVYSAAITISEALGQSAPQWLDNVLVKAMSFEPGDRPPDAATLRTMLTSARPVPPSTPYPLRSVDATESTVPARTADAQAPAPIGERRTHTRRLAAGAVALLTVVALIGILRYGPPDEADAGAADSAAGTVVYDVTNDSHAGARPLQLEPGDTIEQSFVPAAEVLTSVSVVLGRDPVLVPPEQRGELIVGNVRLDILSTGRDPLTSQEVEVINNGSTVFHVVPPLRVDPSGTYIIRVTNTSPTALGIYCAPSPPGYLPVAPINASGRVQSVGTGIEALSLTGAIVGERSAGDEQLPAPSGTAAPELADAEVATFDAERGRWSFRTDDGAVFDLSWGGAGDTPFAVDIDGDGVDELGLFNAQAFGRWSLRNSDGSVFGFNWGGTGDLPFAMDVDGDGRDEVGVFDAEVRRWTFRNPDGTMYGFTWGGDGTPVTLDIDGDGREEVGLFDAASGQWALRNSDGTEQRFSWGDRDDVPLAMDVDRDGRDEVGIYSAGDGRWTFRRDDGTSSGFTWVTQGGVAVVLDRD